MIVIKALRDSLQTAKDKARTHLRLLSDHLVQQAKPLRLLRALHPTFWDREQQISAAVLANMMFDLITGVIGRTDA